MATEGEGAKASDSNCEEKPVGEEVSAAAGAPVEPKGSETDNDSRETDPGNDSKLEDVSNLTKNPSSSSKEHDTRDIPTNDSATKETKVDKGTETDPKTSGGKKKKRKGPKEFRYKIERKPLDPPDGHPLQTPWTIYYHKKPSKKAETGTVDSYRQQLQKLCEFNTIEGFYSGFRYLVQPSEFQNASYFMFRGHLIPVWEEYPSGGCWHVHFPKRDEVNVMWEKLVAACIGEVFEEPDVVGIAVSIRSKEDVISVWNGSNNNKNIRFRIGECLKEILDLAAKDDVTLDYKLHSHSIKDRSTYRNGQQYIVE